MTPPIIAITASRVFKNQYYYNQSPSAYTEAVVRAGGLPFLIPIDYPMAQISRIVDQVNGLLLPGGEDVDHRLYNGEAHLTMDEVSRERDLLEIELVKDFIQAKKPVLGICRGIQLINVALGGTLYTHVPEQFTTEIIHNSPSTIHRSSLVHDVELDSNSKLGKIIGQKQFSVNSFHHQAIRTVAPDLRVTAYATDGLIEAVEMGGVPFGLIGVQWHPECLLSIQPQLEIFRSLIAACQE